MLGVKAAEEISVIYDIVITTLYVQTKSEIARSESLFKEWYNEKKRKRRNDRTTVTHFRISWNDIKIKIGYNER